MSNEQMAELRLSQIRENPVALRGVDPETLKFKELVASIANKGVLMPVRVRPVIDAQSGEQVVENGEPIYSLIDGLQRTTAARHAGLETMKCVVTTASDAEVLDQQIIANVHRLETKPVEYSRTIQRMLSMNPVMTITDAANRVSKSPQWVSEQLGLLKLVGKAADLVDQGHINLLAAYALAKLPDDEQENFIERAQSMDSTEFAATVASRKKELEKARKEGRVAGAEGFTPVMRLQTAGLIKAELANLSIAPELLKQIPNAADLSGNAALVAGFKSALEWVLNVDPISLAGQRQRYEENARKQAEKREARNSGNTEKRAKEARLRSTRALVEAEAIEQGKDVKEVLAAWDKENHWVKGHYAPPEAASTEAAPAA